MPVVRTVVEEQHPHRTAVEAPVVILGYGIWRRAFASDPAAVGQQVILNERPYTIIGVMGPEAGLSRVSPLDGEGGGARLLAAPYDSARIYSFLTTGVTPDRSATERVPAEPRGAGCRLRP